MITLKKKYKGFSLVEMLITIAILGVITLLVATTLTTLIKVSVVSNVKNQARNDVNFIMELMQRSLGNSNVGDITLYDSKAVRTFDRENMIVKTEDVGIGNVYDAEEIVETIPSNEIHVRSYGYNVWTCIGFFLDSNVPEDPEETRYGYLLKTNRYELDDHSECFDENAVVMVLHNIDVKVEDFSVAYLVVGDDGDNMFIISTTVFPSSWPTGFSAPVNKEITRQITVSSQGLTWY
jgi:prepilin-type N-terminal cleavage/methylation domain-containing protein